MASDVIREINLARQHPERVAAFLAEHRQFFDGVLLRLPGQIPLRTSEGVTAVDAAIRFLREQRRLPPLGASVGLSRAALDHAHDAGPRGVIGHTGSDGSQPAERMSRYGSWIRCCGENLSHGSEPARQIVLDLIVDDGVPGRGHRENIYNPAFRVVGVACGPHAELRTMCVMDFAGGYVEKKQATVRSGRRDS